MVEVIVNGWPLLLPLTVLVMFGGLVLRSIREAELEAEARRRKRVRDAAWQRAYDAMGDDGLSAESAHSSDSGGEARG